MGYLWVLCWTQTSSQYTKHIAGTKHPGTLLFLCMQHWHTALLFSPALQSHMECTDLGLNERTPPPAQPSQDRAPRFPSQLGNSSQHHSLARLINSNTIQDYGSGQCFGASDYQGPWKSSILRVLKEAELFVHRVWAEHPWAILHIRHIS